MADITENHTIYPNIEEEETKGFSLKTLISVILLNWYWIVISAAVCYTAAHLYLRYSTPVYNAGMRILIKESLGRRTSSGAELEEMGIVTYNSGFNNELEVLGSASISTRTVKTLKLYTTYRSEGNVVDREMYKTSPVLADIAENRLEELNTTINLVIKQVSEGIQVDGALGGNPEKHATISQTFKSLPATLNTPAGPVILSPNPGHQMTKDRIYVSIRPLEQTGRAFANRLNTSASSRNTVANLTLSETVPARAIDFLTELVNSYNEDANEGKNEVATKTENFIRERLEIIREELDATEGELESFKKQHELINLANNASNALEGSTQYQKKQVEMQTEMTLVKSLLDYVRNPENAFQVVPANLGINNSQFTAAVTAYNDAVLKRNRLLKTGTESTPAIAKLTAELEGIWPTLAQTLQVIYDELKVQKNSIDRQYALFTGRITSTPTQERILNNISRQQEIKAGLYLMLLEKREQNFISLASTAAKARIIDPAQIQGKVSPNDQEIKMIAVAVGMVFPLFVVFLLSLLRYRIEGREDVERLTAIPILADIPLSDTLEPGLRAIVVSENSNNIMDESFRGLRTNLRFVLIGAEKVICCTSCIPGEGKTFVATNLAMSLALLNKKVLLIGLDIRKPRLVKLFNLTSDKQGITSFLSAEKTNYPLLDEQIFHGVNNPNLDVLPAGIIPPNPAELIARPLLDNAIKYLRDKYDYIIIDTPPIGLVSDTLDIGRVADATLVVARADFSIKANFQLINSIRHDKKLPKVNLVLNAVDLTKRKYGYYYGYGKYSTYGKYGNYGYYNHFNAYGIYGQYGKYGNYTARKSKKGKDQSMTER